MGCLAKPGVGAGLCSPAAVLCAFFRLSSGIGLEEAVYHHALIQKAHPSILYAGHEGARQCWSCTSKVQEKPASQLPGKNPQCAHPTCSIHPLMQ